MKIGNILFRGFFLLIFLLLSYISRATWVETFDSTLNNWHGDKEYFRISDGFLRSLGPEKSSVLRLSRKLSLDSADNWNILDSAFRLEVGVKLDFNPSSSNYLRIYLFANDTNLIGDTSVAYYFQLGEKGSENQWTLYFQSPDTTKIIWRGERVYKSSKGLSNKFRLDVSEKGDLKVYQTDSLNAKEWYLDGDSISYSIADSLFMYFASRKIEPPPIDSVEIARKKLTLSIGHFFLNLSKVDSVSSGNLANYFLNTFDNTLNIDSFAISIGDYFMGFNEFDNIGSVNLANYFLSTAKQGKTKTKNSDIKPNITREQFLEKQLYTGLYLKYSTPTRYDKYAFDYVSWVRYYNDFEKEDEGGDGGDEDSTDVVRINYPDSSDILFSEIMFAVETNRSKFIEFYNNTDSSLSLLNLGIGVYKEDYIRYYILCEDSNLKIEPHSYIAFAQDKDKLQGNFIKCEDNIETAHYFPSLSTTKDRLCLVNLSDTSIIDEMYYEREMHHIMLTELNGVSLERISFERSALLYDNWHSASETVSYATPGCENSQKESSNKSVEYKDYFTLSSQLITPNNDGLNDFITIKWNANLQGFLCTINIYDDYGRILRNICSKTMLGSLGSFIFNGLDSNNIQLRPGVYLILIEIINPNGKKRILRIPIGAG